MADQQRILVLGTAMGGGNWPPLAALTAGLHEAGHDVRCFGDTAIMQEFTAATSTVTVVPAAESLGTFLARWRATGVSGPLPIPAWAAACLPSVRSLVREFRPRLLVSEIFTLELARLTKAACGLPWCCVNPGYYFGPDARRPLAADYTAGSRALREQFMQGIGEADLVLHATDPIFDPPPASLPPQHHYVGPMWWERVAQMPNYLRLPGDPWVLVTVSSAPQAGELTLAGIVLRTLATQPVRVVLTLSAQHPRAELGPVPANARVELFVPHAEVLKRSCLVVCHAGHGIVAKALSYGVPLVLIPWGRDQPGVAARAAAIGVAEVIAPEELTEARLAAAITTVLGDPAYKENAARFARRLQANDAVALARAHIEALLESA